MRHLRFSAEVFHFEECRTTLAACAGHHWRRDLPESMIAKVLVDRAERRVANPEDGGHPLGADTEVPHIEQELLARILLDREFFREVHDLEVVRMDFEPAGRSLVREDLAE